MLMTSTLPNKALDSAFAEGTQFLFQKVFVRAEASESQWLAVA